MYKEKGGSRYEKNIKNRHHTYFNGDFGFVIGSTLICNIILCTFMVCETFVIYSAND